MDVQRTGTLINYSSVFNVNETSATGAQAFARRFQLSD